MRLLLLIFLIGFFKSSFSQKNIIDTGSIRNWGGVSNGVFSGNGDYISYSVYDPEACQHCLLVESIRGNWKQAFQNAREASFTPDNKNFVFRSDKDSLCILSLGQRTHADWIAAVKNYKITSYKENTWLLYQIDNESRQLAIRNLTSGKEIYINRVTNYEAKGKILIMEGRDQNNLFAQLNLLDLQTGSLKKIWSCSDGSQSFNYFFDALGEQAGFFTENKADLVPNNKLWYYRVGEDSAIALVSSNVLGLDSTMILSSVLPKFSMDGSCINFELELKPSLRGNLFGSQVHIWSYMDSELLPEQEEALKSGRIFKVLIYPKSGKVLRLEQDNEKIWDENENWALVEKSVSQLSLHEAPWNVVAQSSFYLVSKQNGKRLLIREGVKNSNEKPALSPGGKWIIYFDFQRKNFFSYEIATGIVRNITKAVTTNWMQEEFDTPEKYLTWFPSQKTWLKDDKAVFVYDNYDIWLIDPSGVHQPVNLTEGYGITHKIRFFLAQSESVLKDISIDKPSTLLLTAFNKTTKQMGFFYKILGTKGDPKMISMGPYLYGNVFEGVDVYQETSPLTIHANTQYLILRQSGTDAPNYFLSSDLKTFKRITNVQPQKKYNWYTSELCNWKSFNGEMLQGILYKPENFNVTKKYPVIFEYYERKSDLLNKYITPELSTGDINIPWFVNRGYLVFVPDIHYTIGSPGKSAYDAVLSAAQYLSHFSFIDSTKMGLQGHSFGAYETNYIITHSKKFAAACSAAGVTDLISRYGSAERGGYSMSHTEYRQGRIGYSFVARPDLYIENSPIFAVNRIVTPLLMLNNKADKQVPFTQGAELFTQMRRLGKKVWMLQYNDGGHGVYDSSALDYTIRLLQFFDHYLKDSACPKWMLYRIGASQSGIDDGLDLVREKNPKTGTWLTPPEGGLLTQEEKKKVEELKHRKPIIITLE